MTVVRAKPRLLCVDDEPELLDNIRLVLRKHFDVSTVQSGPEALALFDDDEVEPFDVVLSDMRMPEMSGAALLTSLRRSHPEVPRLLLSGQSDLDSAIAAINHAKVFRFLTKPCPPDLLIESIEDAVRQARLEHIEKDLLDRTLNGTVDMLTDVLGLVSPEAVERAARIKSFVYQLCVELNRPVDWKLDLGCMLSQIGFVAMPSDDDGEESPELLERRVELAAELLIRIPRLESVAALIRGQLSPTPVKVDETVENWTDREMNAEILRLAVLYERRMAEGQGAAEAAQSVIDEPEPAAAFLRGAIARIGRGEQQVVQIEVGPRDLQPGMVLVDDLLLSSGPKLAPAGMELTAALIGRIQTFARTPGVAEPIVVEVLGAIAEQLDHAGAGVSAS
ncbi:MAG: response regulator [Actinomycetota bacterium]